MYTKILLRIRRKINFVFYILKQKEVAEISATFYFDVTNRWISPTSIYVTNQHEMGGITLETKIAICGTLRSGKDSVAKLIRSKEDFYTFAFSEGIWATIKLLFPKEYAKRHEEKPRKLLQDIGQGMRQVDSNVWIQYTFNRIIHSGAEKVLITDLRQLNEYEALKEAGFYIVRVDARPEVRIARAKAAGDNFNIRDMLHETERHVQNFKVDFDIDNNGTFEELDKQVIEMLEQIIQDRKGTRW